MSNQIMHCVFNECAAKESPNASFCSFHSRFTHGLLKTYLSFDKASIETHSSMCLAQDLYYFSRNIQGDEIQGFYGRLKL